MSREESTVMKLEISIECDLVLSLSILMNNLYLLQ